VKLACLNALSCVVTLRFHQIEYLDNGDLPEKLDDSLVFGTEHISAIRASILQLHDDKLLLKERKRLAMLFAIQCLIYNKKAVLSQRWPRDVPYIWIPWKFSAVPGYAHAPFCPKFLLGFCWDGPYECTGQIWSP